MRRVFPAAEPSLHPEAASNAAIRFVAFGCKSGAAVESAIISLQSAIALARLLLF